MENPYPSDKTVQSFLHLYEKFLEASHEELLMYKTSIKKAQQKLDVADTAMKSFEDHIWDRLSGLIRMLPISKCVFCGGDVVDKTPLRPFVEQLRPVSDTDRYWFSFEATDMKLSPECQSCGVYKIGSEGYIRLSKKKWSRDSQRKPKFVISLFDKYPFVTAFSETETPFRWTIALQNGEYWCLDGTKEEVITQLGLTGD